MSPDISMCQNKDCLQKFDCHRFMAKPKEMFQSWSEFKPDSDGVCKSFMKRRTGV